MYLNALNKNNNHLKSTWFYLVQSLLFPVDLRRILHMHHTDAMLNQKFNKMFVLVCSAVSLMKTAQRQIKVADRIFLRDSKSRHHTCV